METDYGDALNGFAIKLVKFYDVCLYDNVVGG